MRRAVRSNRRPIPLLAILLLAVALSAACLAGLWALDLVDFPFLARKATPRSTAGLERIPLSGRAIPAFSRITRDSLWDAKAGDFTWIWLPKGELGPEFIRDPNLIMNRVLSHDKPAQYAFTEKDFLPEGTRPGVVGGTPPGKRAVTLGVEHLSGFDSLKTGDHLDLLATVPIDTSPVGAQTGLQAKELAAQAEYAKIRKRASVRVLAEDAVVVSPVHSRDKPVTSSSLMSGTQTRTVPVQEIVVAVNPDEVAKVEEAAALHLAIACVLRSGRPDDPDRAVPTPGADPLGDAPVSVVETITGSKRDAQVFTSSGTRIKVPVQSPAVPVPAGPAGPAPMNGPVVPTSGNASPGAEQFNSVDRSEQQPRTGRLTLDESPFGDEERSAASE